MPIDGQIAGDVVDRDHAEPARGRLHVEGLDVPDEFVLLLSGDGMAQESTCKVVWRSGHEVGAKFVSVVRRPGFAMRD